MRARTLLRWASKATGRKNTTRIFTFRRAPCPKTALGGRGDCRRAGFGDDGAPRQQRNRHDRRNFVARPRFAVGGVKEKVLAAHRAGLTRIILPEENERDLDDIPKEVRDALQFHIISDLGEAIKLALANATPAEVVKKEETPDNVVLEKAKKTRKVKK